MQDYWIISKLRQSSLPHWLLLQPLAPPRHSSPRCCSPQNGRSLLSFGSASSSIWPLCTFRGKVLSLLDPWPPFAAVGSSEFAVESAVE